MNIYTCTNFKGHYPVGTAAVVVAENKGEAERLLRDMLHQEDLGYDKTPYVMELVDPNVNGAIVLLNGDY